MKILVCGAGISGTALAFWLSKQTHQHTITVLERFPTLRTSGLQIDLRGPGIQVLRRMGLERAFREKAVAEQGLQVVDKRGRRWGYFPANRSGKGLQSFTTEFEIMRGDLCGLLFEACGGQTVNQIGVRFVFGVYVVRVTQVEGGVEVVFSDGKRGLFDLVVGADGLGSRMRRMMFGVEGEGEDANPGYHSLGAYAGYCTIRQDMRAGEGYDATAFITTGARGIMTRRHEPERYQAYVFCESSASKRLGNASKGDIEEEKIALAEVFRGAGWESDSILQGLVQSDDFYCERIGVIKLDNWSQGRIALLGDAAYGPSAMTGMGTSCAMAGAYILAGEIGKGSSEGDITTALKNYEQKMRPFIDQVQKGLTDDDNYMGRFPTSSFGITLVYCLVWVASIMRLDILARWVLREDTKDWELPEYPDMDGSS
ncbi:hypothetical protein BDW59DRAFT_173627 [Aspergillus cavernicola]|uniref:FAD-binding domain-containing protein n=1 Tax=Aspergillus cavernicola TaxID=176166 RepID=A0ABR4I6P6_9EURO